MKSLLKSCDVFVAEMELVYRKAERQPRWRFIHANIGNIQLMIYFLVVLLNINVLFSPALFHPSDMKNTNEIDLVQEWGFDRRLKAKKRSKSTGDGDGSKTFKVKEFYLPPFECIIYGFTGNLDEFELNDKMR